ncbi:hypothetical protein QR77_25740 [Streptomyces sp. 150FB]|uniref:DUF4232 domain-containing protein n=1 Tax=Streptomyces sp. 150FB TaxID=1576605 RepID=UPI000588FAD3|nr:DUF4232 domain-containing protein [Streptomyces sp. 150FB]KIF76366.1 hypothetical protein QR77_25740 [Streptomyces sp. 150FB]
MRRNMKLSVLALTAVAAGLSLTACGTEGVSASASTSLAGASAVQNASSNSAPDAASPAGAAARQNASSSSRSGSDRNGGSGASNSGAGSASRSASSSGTMCKSSNLAFSTHHGIEGEQEIVVFKNIGSATCTMRGYAGVDLKGNDSDDAISVARVPMDTPTIRLAPGEQTDFVLDYPRNDSGGSGYTFTTMIVTPPNETHSKTLSTSINVPLDNPDQGSDDPGIVLNPVGAGK